MLSVPSSLTYCCRHYEGDGHWLTFSRKSDLLRWSLTFITGMLCGVVALLVSYLTKILTSYKFSTFNSLIESEKSLKIPYGSAYLFVFLCNLLFGFVAWAMVSIEPLASGSGECTAIAHSLYESIDDVLTFDLKASRK